MPLSPLTLTCPLPQQAKADLMERRLVAASKLIAGLGSERQRWGQVRPPPDDDDDAPPATPMPTAP